MMNILTLPDLPIAPPDKTGWPWTQSGSQLNTLEDAQKPWPKVSLVVPSLNQAQFIEQAIRSVLLQGYPNLELILIDGGSTDGSLEIIKKYRDYLAFWISQKDRGQSQALNKGFAKSSGEILGWLNADDLLKPDVLRFVAENLTQNLAPAWLVGATEVVDAQSRRLGLRLPGRINAESIVDWPKNWFGQPSTFWNRRMWQLTGSLDERLDYAMDLALWLKMIHYAVPLTTEKILSAYRLHRDSKALSATSRLYLSIARILSRQIKHPPKQISRGIVLRALLKAACRCPYHLLIRQRASF